MSLRERIAAFFAADSITPNTPADKPAEGPVGSPGRGMTGDVAYSESIIYAGADWPKYQPDELIRTRGSKIYAQMMVDEQIKACVHFKRGAITGRRWYFDVKPKKKPDDGDPAIQEEQIPDTKQPGSYRRRKVIKYYAGQVLLPEPPAPPKPGEAPAPKPKDPEQLELERRAYVLEACFEQMEGSLLDALNGIMSSLSNGFSMTEKVLKQIEVDGKTWWGIKRLRVKPFASFQFFVDPYGNIEKVLQRWEAHEQRIDISKFIHHVQNPDVDLHYGQSELREAYRAWFSKDMAIRFWNIHLERHASGFLCIEPDKDAGVNIRANTPEYNAIVQVLNNLSVKSGVLLPNGVKAHLEKPNNTDAYEKAIDKHDLAIAKALLVPNLLGITGQQQTGSYSQSQTQLEAFLWTLDCEATRLEETIFEQVIKPLCETNFGSPPYPRFCFEPISDALKLLIVKQWGELVRAGAVQHTDTDEDHVREIMDFPERGAPIQSPIAIDPNKVDPETGKPHEPPGAGKSPEDDDETIIGRNGVKTTRKAFKIAKARAVRRVDFAIIERKATAIEEITIQKMDDALRQGIASMRTAIRSQDVKANPEAVADIALPSSTKRKLKDYMRAGMGEAWGLGEGQAVREIRRAKGQEYDRGPLDDTFEQYIESKASTFSADIAENTRKKVATILFNGIKGDWTVDEMVSRIDDLIDSESIPQLSTAVRTLTFEAINEARYNYFTQPALDNYVQALEFSAVIDGKTTDICRSMDGHVHAIDSDVWSNYTPPLHFNCRSLLIPVTMDDAWQESSAPTVEPEF